MRLDEKLGVDPRDCFGGKRRSKLIFFLFSTSLFPSDPPARRGVQSVQKMTLHDLFDI